MGKRTEYRVTDRVIAVAGWPKVQWTLESRIHDEAAWAIIHIFTNKDEAYKALKAWRAL